MATRRGDMTVRVVPLQSAEAGDSRVGGTMAERIALVTALSEELWVRTQQPLPTYARDTMPFALFPLRAPSVRE